MFRPPCLLLAVLALATVARQSRAASPDAAELAGLIDRHVDARLADERVPAAGPGDDAEFLRRAYLDLHGLIPTREQADRFLADPDPAKRARLVDALLADPRYGEHLADVWQGYLISPLADDPRMLADRLRPWLAARFNTHTWDRIASDLLTAAGKMEDQPAVTYLIEGRHPRSVPDLTDLASRYFMGVRLNCAQCHDHPFAPWKQQDFWGMAAFFAPVQTPGRAKQVYQLGVVDDARVTLATLKDAGMIDGFMPRPPTFLGGGDGGAVPTADAGTTTGRAALARWMTSPDNPFFARAMANRTWWRLFGRGIVRPVDDMHEGNPPSHPELLDLLALRFAESGFDLKFLTRAIMLTRAYQRTSRTGDGSTATTPEAVAATEKQAELFGRMSVKVLSAGQLYDSLATIFGPPEKTAGLNVPRQHVRAEFTQFFGDAGGDPDPTAYRRGIPHLLRQMNSGQFAGRSLDALIDRLSASGRASDDAATDLFLTILSRRPTADELQRFRAYAAAAGSERDARRELAWALVMTSEFSLNR